MIENRSPNRRLTGFDVMSCIPVTRTLQEPTPYVEFWAYRRCTYSDNACAVGCKTCAVAVTGKQKDMPQEHDIECSFRDVVTELFCFLVIRNLDPLNAGVILHPVYARYPLL